MALSINRAWDETREILAKDGKLVAIVAAALVMLPVALNTMIEPGQAMPSEEAQSPTGGIVGLLVILVALIGQIAIVSVGLRKGGTVGDAISTGARKFLPVLGAGLLFFVPMIVLLAAVVMAGVGVADAAQLQARLAAGQIGGGVLLFFLVWLAAMLFLGIRFALTTPVGVAETSNPVTMLKRSWELTKGHFWKILGFALLLGIVTVIAMMAVAVLVGLLSAAVLGAPEPMSLSALLLGLFSGAIQAAFVTVYMLMLARIYAQLVPDTGALKDVFA